MNHGTWNHRVIQTKEKNGDDCFAIHEVFYNGDGKPRAHTENAVGVLGESINELRETLKRMRKALDTPVMTPDDFPPMDEDIFKE